VNTAAYPFDLPAVLGLRDAGVLELPAGVTFLVGDNGSGKSTLVEAVAVAAGFKPKAGHATSGSPPVAPSRCSGGT